MRVAYKKIASFLPFSDGVGIIKDSATALPQIFVTGSDFAFDMVTRLAHLSTNPAEDTEASPVENPLAVTSDMNDPELSELIYQNAVDVVVRTQRATISGLQRHLRVGFAMAARLMELLEADGVVSAPGSDGTRHVLRSGHAS